MFSFLCFFFSALLFASLLICPFFVWTYKVQNNLWRASLCCSAVMLCFCASLSCLELVVCRRGAVLPTSLLEHHSMSQSSQTHQRSPHRMRDKWPHADTGLENTARVSPPRNWKVSIGWHTHPREGADTFSVAMFSPFVTETWVQKMALFCFQRWCRERFRACVMTHQATANDMHSLRITANSSTGTQQSMTIPGNLQM